MTAKEKKPEYVNRRPQPPTTGVFLTNSGVTLVRTIVRWIFGAHFVKEITSLLVADSLRNVVFFDERSIIVRVKESATSGAKHHTSICTAQIQKQRPPAFLKQEETPKGNRTVSTNLYFTRNMSNEHILLQTARAKVHSPRSDSSSQS